MTSRKSPNPKVKKLKPKLREKISVIISDDVTIYDYTIFKLESLIKESQYIDPDHPDLYVLQLILNCYLQGEYHVDWYEGYPMIDF